MSDAPDSFPLEVMLFASLKEKAGRPAVAVAVPAGTTVGGLKPLLGRAEPAIAPYLEATRVAVNLAFAPPEQPLAPQDKVALIPPVGGG